MATTSDAYLRARLAERRKKLEAAAAGTAGDSTLAELLLEVDLALERMGNGTYGLCEECHESIEQERLIADPLVRLCIDHLTSEQARALERDLELAARIQRGLLPPRSLHATGWQAHYHYEPAGTVSGDYCDLIHSNGNSGDLFFALGDVTGKGVAASMLMTHLHAMFRSLTSVGLPLDQLLSLANRVFCESTTAGQYATLACGRAKSTGEVELSSAGHLPALLVRKGKVTQLEATGLPLGMFLTGQYSVEKFSFEPGDNLVLYTDGFSEALNHANAEYGADRLARVLTERHGLSPEAIVAACLNDWKAHAKGVSQADDQTLLVIQRH